MTDFHDFLKSLQEGALAEGKLKEAFVHCHECEWSQDDFWHDGYNPVRFLLNWEKELLGENLDKSFTDDAGFIEENGNISLREVIARECENAAAKIRGMHFLKQPDMREVNCPKCGSSLCVD